MGSLDFMDLNWINIVGLPSPWQNQDVGTPGAAGSASYSAGTFTINANGNDIWDTSDNFHYVYQSLSGDCEIVAHVVSIENTNAWAKAGVMIRETLTGGSKHAMMVVTPGNGTSFQRRTTTDGASDDTTLGDGITAPYWVKIVRSGDTFTGYKSDNGSDWVSVGSATFSMASDVYIGMPVTSHSDGVLCTAEIDNVTVTTGG
jgi:regulation of enolase protein 1 (concanavalin A-like superfamily)